MSADLGGGYKRGDDPLHSTDPALLLQDVSTTWSAVILA